MASRATHPELLDSAPQAMLPSARMAAQKPNAQILSFQESGGGGGTSPAGSVGFVTEPRKFTKKSVRNIFHLGASITYASRALPFPCPSQRYICSWGNPICARTR